MVFLVVPEIIWFFLPSYAANISASLLRPRFLDFPISERLAGTHKTYRGFLVGTLFAILTAYVQRILFPLPVLQELSRLDYQKDFVAIGILLGFGALSGDFLKSLFKRRLDKAPGERWIPFDQMDHTLGALLFISLIWRPPLDFIAMAIVVNFLFHIFINHLGFWVGIRSSPR